MNLSENEDWIVDEEDPAVGIFGDVIFHNSCKDEEPQPAVDEVISTKTLGDVTFVTHNVTCACGAQTSYVETDYSPQDDPDWWDDGLEAQ